MVHGKQNIIVSFDRSNKFEAAIFKSLSRRTLKQPPPAATNRRSASMGGELKHPPPAATNRCNASMGGELQHIAPAATSRQNWCDDSDMVVSKITVWGPVRE